MALSRLLQVVRNLFLLHFHGESDLGIECFENESVDLQDGNDLFDESVLRGRLTLRDVPDHIVVRVRRPQQEVVIVTS